MRVELSALTADDFYRILTEPAHSMVKQQQALLATEGVRLVFEEGALRAHLPDIPVIGTVRERESIRKADLAGRSPFDVEPAFVAEIAGIKERLSAGVAASN